MKAIFQVPYQCDMPEMLKALELHLHHARTHRTSKITVTLECGEDDLTFQAYPVPEMAGVRETVERWAKEIEEHVDAGVIEQIRQDLASGKITKEDFDKRQSLLSRYAGTKINSEFYKTIKVPEPIICDGCSVREPWEHKCHGTNCVVKGEHTTLDCECEQCNRFKL